MEKIISELEGTREKEILVRTEELYEKIKVKQEEWYKKSSFTCPENCGECCRNFEPDLLECEAVYMAAWLLENDAETAEKVAEGNFPYPENKGCPFWKEEASYHCTIYGGRSFICRFFGACGSRSKTGDLAFKPCKFYPAEKLAAYKIPLYHKQYSEEEMKKIFPVLPPVTTDIMEEALSLNPGKTNTVMLRKILPETIRRLQWLCIMNATV